MSNRSATLFLLLPLATAAAWADYTPNIMLTGYWRPTNNMIRHFSTNIEQNPDGWQGENWEDSGYNIHSFFPEFPDGLGKGVGDFEVDYQDTSADFWRIVEEVRPVAIITFGRGGNFDEWEIESRARNLDQWVDDYEDPRQPTPAAPDPNVPVDHIRYSSLPMDNIADAVNALADVNVDAWVDYDSPDFAGAFLCEYIGYHAAWYHDLHSDPSDPYWNAAAGHIHVGRRVGQVNGRIATEASLREVIDYVDSLVPEPTSIALLAGGLIPGVSSALNQSPERDRPASRAAATQLTNRHTPATAEQTAIASPSGIQV